MNTSCTACGLPVEHAIDGMCITCWFEADDLRQGITYRYFLKLGQEPETEVSMENWVSAERRAGFVNTLDHPDRPGTGGFSTTAHGGIEGRIERVVPTPE